MRICTRAGLTGDDELRIHDLRHEAISRVAEASSNTPGGFTLVDLQAFSGHRDTRMLLRYAHLCAQSLAKRLDAAFADTKQVGNHHGRRRLKEGADVSIGELAGGKETQTEAPKLPSFAVNIQPTAVMWGNVTYKSIE